MEKDGRLSASGFLECRKKYIPAMEEKERVAVTMDREERLQENPEWTERAQIHQ